MQRWRLWSAMMIVGIALAPSVLHAEGPTPSYLVRPTIELGGVAVLSHRVQFGREGTYFDYVRDGGQDNLFFAWRLSVDVELASDHLVTLLYQPLALDTRARLARELVLDGVTFPAGAPMAFKYGFPFFRVSYIYQVVRAGGTTLGVGGSAQIRNATIEFSALDGSELSSYRNIGFVPLLRARLEHELGSGVFFGAEVDGIYAPIPGANGSANRVTGALLDASVRLSLVVAEQARLFLNVRYLGGGATGQSDPEPFSDGYTRNWIHLLNISVGGSIAGPSSP